METKISTKLSLSLGLEEKGKGEIIHSSASAGTGKLSHENQPVPPIESLNTCPSCVPARRTCFLSTGICQLWPVLRRGSSHICLMSAKGDWSSGFLPLDTSVKAEENRLCPPNPLDSFDVAESQNSIFSVISSLKNLF